MAEANLTTARSPVGPATTLPAADTFTEPTVLQLDAPRAAPGSRFGAGSCARSGSAR